MPGAFSKNGARRSFSLKNTDESPKRLPSSRAVRIVMTWETQIPGVALARVGTMSVERCARVIPPEPGVLRPSLLVCDSARPMSARLKRKRHLVVRAHTLGDTDDKVPRVAILNTPCVVCTQISRPPRLRLAAL